MENKENIYTGIIYCLTNVITKQIYIGQAISFIVNHGKIKRHGLEGRFKSHKYDSIKRIKACPKLYNAICKYGIGNFSKKIIYVCPIELLNEVEAYFIKKFDSVKNGYNIASNLKCNNINRNKRIENLRNTMKKKWDKDQNYIDKVMKLRLKDKKLDHNKNQLPRGIWRELRKDNDGYTIAIPYKGKRHYKYFHDPKFTMDQKLKMAIEYLNINFIKCKNNEKINSDKKKAHNNEELPRGIRLMGINIGYEVVIYLNHKRKNKKFMDSKLTMDEKLNLAKEYHKKIKNNNG